MSQLYNSKNIEICFAWPLNGLGEVLLGFQNRPHVMNLEYAQSFEASVVVSACHSNSCPAYRPVRGNAVLACAA